MADLVREYDYTVDAWTLASVVMPEVWRRIDTQVQALAQSRNLKVQRSAKPVANIPGLQNGTWRARNGMAAGFTVAVEHKEGNYLHVKVTAKPFYPIAGLISLALGLLVSWVWIPYLLSNWNAMLANPLFIVAVVVMWIIFVFATRTLFVSAILAFLSTFVFGFIGGYALGWGIGSVLGDAQSGEKIRPALVAIVQGVERPGPPPAPRPPSYPMPGSAPVAPMANTPAYIPTPRPVRPGPAPPAQRQAPAAAPPTFARVAEPAAAPELPPCPTCGKGVSPGSASCAWCGQSLVW